MAGRNKKTCLGKSQVVRIFFSTPLLALRDTLYRWECLTYSGTIRRAAVRLCGNLSDHRRRGMSGWRQPAPEPCPLCGPRRGVVSELALLRRWVSAVLRAYPAAEAFPQ